MDLNSQGFDVVGTVSTTGEIRQVELDLVPSLIESHGHGANERLDTGSGLVVGSSESSAYVLVIEDLHFKSEVLLQLNGQTMLAFTQALTFLMIMTRKGSLMARVFLGSTGQVM